LFGCSSSSDPATVVDSGAPDTSIGSETGADAAGEGGAGPCTLPARPYWSSPGCDAAPTCLVEFVADAPGPSDFLCGCDGVTRPGGPPSSAPYTHVGACEGADAPASCADKPVSGKCASGCFQVQARPWKGSCFGPTEVVGCAEGADGGTAFTCGAQISTGKLWEFPTTQLPQDGDWRFCTDTEKSSIALTTYCDAG
jgi:hypothetical protein